MKDWKIQGTEEIQKFQKMFSGKFSGVRSFSFIYAQIVIA